MNIMEFVISSNILKMENIITIEEEIMNEWDSIYEEFQSRGKKLKEKANSNDYELFVRTETGLCISGSMKLELKKIEV